MTAPLHPMADRRSRLLAHNAGTWTGQFVRLDASGVERDRFDSQLLVTDRDGLIEANLTNLASGEVRRMAFREPPADMQISPQGHWSLGPDRIGPWPWVSELCLVHGEQRRRAVVRLGSDRLESLVIVWEGRPGQANPPPPPPLRARAAAGEQGRSIWTIEAGLEIGIPARRQQGSAQSVLLRWQPRPGLMLEIERAYDAYGNPLGLGGAGGADWPGTPPP